VASAAFSAAKDHFALAGAALEARYDQKVETCNRNVLRVWTL